MSKSRENRLRRTAERRGFTLTKSRRRDPLAIDYGRWWLTRTDTGDPVGRTEGTTDLDEVESWLHSQTGWQDEATADPIADEKAALNRIVESKQMLYREPVSYKEWLEAEENLYGWLG